MGKIILSKKKCAQIFRELSFAPNFKIHFHLFSVIVLIFFNFIGPFSFYNEIQKWDEKKTYSEINTLKSDHTFSEIEIQNDIFPFAESMKNTEEIKNIKLSERDTPELLSNYHAENHPNRFQIINNYSLMVSDSLKIFDISNVSNPIPISQFDDVGIIYSLKIVEDLLFLGGEGLKIFNITEKENPILISNIEDIFCIDLSVDLLNNLLYVAEGYLGKFSILDINDISTPIILSSTNLGDNVNCIYEQNNRVFCGTNSELVIYNGYNPMYPIFVSRINLGNELHQILKESDELFIASGRGLEIVDIHNDLNPHLSLTYEDVGALYHIKKEEDSIHALSWYSGYYIINISSRVSITNINIVSGHGRYFATNGDICYILTENENFCLYLFDISDKPNITIIKEKTFSSGHYLCCDIIEQNILSIGLFGGMFQFVNITNLTNPILISEINTGGYIYDIERNEDILFLADANGGIIVLNISNIYSPVEEYTFSCDVYPHDIKLVNNFLLCSGSNGVNIMNITGSKNLDLLAYIETDATVESIISYENVMFFSTSNKFYTYNISNFSKPVEIGSMNIADIIKIYLQNENVWVSTADDGILIFNTTNVENLTLIKQFIQGVPSTIFFDLNLAILNNFGRNIEFYNIIDIINPVNLNITSSVFHIPVMDGELLNGYIFSLSRFNGLDIIDPWLDQDGDGIRDTEEINIYNTNYLSADTDSDGYNDFFEIEYNTNPLNPASNPTIHINETISFTSNQDLNSTFCSGGDGTIMNPFQFENLLFNFTTSDTYFSFKNISDHVIIKNCTFIGYDNLDYALYINGSSNIEMHDCYFHFMGSDWDNVGIRIENSLNSAIEGCIFRKFEIVIESSQQLFLSNNFLIDHWILISIYHSSYLTISNSQLFNSDRGIYTSNSEFLNISNNHFDKCGVGIELSSTNCEITQNEIARGFNGILIKSSNNEINTNQLSNISNTAIIVLPNVWNTSIYDNLFLFNNNGIKLEQNNTDCVINANNLYNQLDSGIILNQNSNNNTISNNNINNSFNYGITIVNCDYNTIKWNNISFNRIGVNLDDSTGGHIEVFKNNFINNSLQHAYDQRGNIWSVDEWGNYWDDYDDANSEISRGYYWNIPYQINKSSIDEFPLINYPQNLITNIIRPQWISIDQNISTSHLILSWYGMTDAITYQLVINEDDDIFTDQTQYDVIFPTNGRYVFTLMAYYPEGGESYCSLPLYIDVAYIPNTPVISSDSETTYSLLYLLKWNEVNNVHGYNIYLNKSVFETIQSNFIYINFPSFGQYEIEVSAFNELGESNKSRLFILNVIDPSGEGSIDDASDDTIVNLGNPFLRNIIIISGVLGSGILGIKWLRTKKARTLKKVKPHDTNLTDYLNILDNSFDSWENKEKSGEGKRDKI